MRTLIIGYNPSGIYGYSEITRNIIEHHDDDNGELFLYYEGSANSVVKKNKITIISRINEVASVSVSAFLKNHYFYELFYFVLQKISYKFFPLPDKRIKYNKRNLKKLNKEYCFDQLIILNDCNYWFFQITKRLNIAKKKIFIIEPPFVYKKNHHKYIRDNKKDINHTIIKQLSKADYKIYMPQLWYRSFGYLIKNQSIEILEFPFLVKYNPNDCYNKQLIYTGRFYYDIRNPQQLFDLMTLLSDYQLHIYGEDLRNDKRYRIPENVYFHESEHMEKLHEVISNCSALINVENSSNTIHVSSKIISYFGFQKPILSFGERDELAEEYKKYGSFYNVLVNGSLKEIDSIKKWLDNAKNTSIDINTHPFNKYTIQFFIRAITQ